MILFIALRPLEMMIEETMKYTETRKIFGKAVLDNQSVHFRLAELQTEVELLRALIYRSIGQYYSQPIYLISKIFVKGLYVKGIDVTNLASMCKLKAGRLTREASDACLQYWGGMGFTYENIVSRYYRLVSRLHFKFVSGIFYSDLRLTSIGGGADEVMLSIICKYMGTLPKPNK